MAIRIGIDLGLFPNVERSLADELFIITQPAHLQRAHEGKLSAEERDLLRADMLRERLKQVSRPIIKPPTMAVTPEPIRVFPKLNSLTGMPNPIITTPTTTATAPTPNNRPDIRVTILY